MARQSLARAGRRRVTVRVTCDPRAVEATADAMGMAVSDEEAAAILDNVDGALPRLASLAVHDAVQTAIADQLRLVAGGHAGSDED